nr:unnamed protein product [Callosobruchus chinensis]
MTSIQERLQLKREPIDKWSIREQLCLASAVSRSGDQNWMSVSRSLKPFGEPNRPPDWFHQKNCAAQYGMLLANVETPKRKKRTSIDSGIETPTENILRRLLIERQAELKKLLAEEKAEYQKLQEDMISLQSGKVTEEQLDKWCKEIDEEEYKREQEAIAHAQWLKEREQRKQEIERAWRPTKHSQLASAQKRKTPDLNDSGSEEHHQIQSDELQIQQQMNEAKPALSPLLTSLLKSPSQVQGGLQLTTRHVISNNPNPTIASLLNSSPGVTQLVSTAIGQEPPTSQPPATVTAPMIENVHQDLSQQHITSNDLLGDANLTNIKIDDLANSMLVQDGPLPEIKKEEQHLQLDGNGDISINLDQMEDLEEDIQEEELLAVPPSAPPPVEVPSESEPPSQEPAVPQPPKEEPIKNEEKKVEKPVVIDPFEFSEDPVQEEHVQPTTEQNLPPPVETQEAELIKADPVAESVQIEDCVLEDTAIQIREEVEEVDDKEMLPKEEIKPEKPSAPRGSVEIIEHKAADSEEDTDEFNQTPIPEIVESTNPDNVEIKAEKIDTEEEKTETETESYTTESKDTASVEESSETSDTMPEIKKEPVSLDTQDSLEMPSTAQEFSEDLYDELSMEVKIDKTGKAKRDYSRTKKKEDSKEDHGFDMLLAIEKAQLEDADLTEETLSDNTTDLEKKDSKSQLKYSTPATPVDSVPNSPASSTAFNEDDRDYKNWKKSVMLVYNRLASNKYASLFLKPITDDQAPGYSTIVYRPMDLQMIKKNIENGSIRTTLEFKRDTMLMFTNAMMYNKTNDTIYNMALQMQQESLQPIEILMQATTRQDAPIRRETRTSESGIKRKRTVTVSEDSKKKKKDE